MSYKRVTILTGALVTDEIIETTKKYPTSAECREEGRYFEKILVR